ncbi:MAG TPA: DUF4115 domain-containing protein [Syntrophales bacterium]|nr:DUF4115 domain-containing protein [Syntrophales bacterium]
MEDAETTRNTAPDQAFPVQDLKSLRESQGIQLKDIFEATRITIINLEAIETGRFGKLPAPVIARSFIRSYARSIGADEGKLLERYNRFLAESEGPSLEEVLIPPKKKSLKKWIVTISCLALALIIAAAVLMLREPVPAPSAPSVPSAAAPPAQPTETATPAPATQQPPAGAPGSPPAAPEPSASAPAPTPAVVQETPQPRPPSAPTAAPAPAATDGYSLVIEARDYTWIRLSEDQSQPYQVLLKPGERLERRASRSFDIDVGNAGGTQLTFQGKPLGPLGAPGQVVHLRLP